MNEYNLIGGDILEKEKVVETFQRLTVYLPPDIEKAVYADFLALARSAVEEATRNVTVNNRFLNTQQLCAYFKCGHSTIQEWRTKGLRSFMKGKEVMFDLKDVEEFIETQKQ